MAEIRAKSTDQRKTHDISLSDGTTEIGLTLSDFKGRHDPNAIKQVGNPRTALQIRQGQAEYSDFEMPYTPIIQNDWSGGLGNRYLDKDKSRFRMSYRMDTTRPNELKLGPAEFHPSGVMQTRFNYDVYMPVETKYYDIPQVKPTTQSGYYSWIKNSFVAEYTETNPILRIVGKNLYSREIKISIYSDSSDAPNTELWTETRSGTETHDVGYLRFETTVSLTAGTKYWIVARVNYPYQYQGYITSSSQASTIYTNSATLPASGWTLNTYGIAFAIYSKQNTGNSFFFNYRKSTYMVTSPDYGEVPRLYIEGYHGLAQANTGHLELLKTGLTLTEDELVDAIVYIVAGKGSAEQTNWRKISSNTAGGDVTVYPSWNIVHDATTEYAIIGTHKFTLITTTGLTVPVTDVLVSDSIVYFAQGDSVNIRRMREYDNSGTWTRQFADDGSNKATFLARGPKTDGTQQIWRANNNPPSCSYSGVKAWGTDLSFGTAITCGDTFNKITNLIFYGNPLIPWVIKEDRFGSINDNIFAEVPISEMRNVASDRNGKAAMHFGVYLYFSLLGGLERYYDGRLDDVGPNRDEGMYDSYSGDISALVSYPGRFYAAVDSGDNPMSSSSILCHNGVGWHNIYSVGGKRIRNLYVQTIPTGIDRLWFCEDGEPTYLYISLYDLSASSLENQSLAYYGSYFTDYAAIDLATITAGFRDINKYFGSLSTFGDQFSTSPFAPTYCTFYQITGAQGRSNETIESLGYVWRDSDEIDFSPGVNAKELNIKIFFNRTAAVLSSHKLNAIRFDAVTRIPIKRSWSIMFKVQTSETDMNGDRSALTAKQIYDQLENWANSDITPGPLTLRSNHQIFDDRTVFIEPASIQPLRTYNTRTADSENETIYIGQLSVYEA